MTHEPTGQKKRSNLKRDLRKVGFRDRRNLITLRIDDDLAETDMIGCCPCADHMDRRFATGFVVAATERLTIDRNDLSVTDLLHCTL